MAENVFNTRLSDEIKISLAAAAQLSSLLDDEEGVDGIRIYVSGEGCSGMSYAMNHRGEAESIRLRARIGWHENVRPIRSRWVFWRASKSIIKKKA